MDGDAAQMWHQTHELGAGRNSANLNDDFTNFLDFGDIPLNLPSPYDTTPNGNDPLAMDTDFCLDGRDTSSSVAGQQLRITTQSDMMDIQFHDMQKSMEAAHEHMMNLRQQEQSVHHQGGMIPPTPNSIDMQSGLPPANFYNSNVHAMDRFRMYREDALAFSPLISPAVTPLETEFSSHLSDWSSGAFSPLTSPALGAHHHRTHMPNPHVAQNPAHINTPAEQSRSPANGKKAPATRRKSASVSRNPSRVVRESPSMKPQRRRPPPVSTPGLTPALLAVAGQNQLSLAPASSQCERRNSTIAIAPQSSTPTQRSPSRDESSNESVSPEPLSEVRMAPPPPPSLSSRPVSTDGSNTQRPFGAPVTPASLMKLVKTAVRTEDIPPISMDTADFLNRDVEITEDARNATSTRESRSNSDAQTPTLSRPGSKTPSLAPSPSKLTPAPTPLEPRSSGISKKEPPIRSRKRGSVSSSPALQPKISPNIKPLLPMGMSPDTSAFLLASKSNYQNIVEGNHNHLGLQYPETLSNHLTSKRTSHKLAEQGRRNRINNALTEMASLLPPGTEGSTPVKEQTSKASTVELAIEYIKQLKKELDETKMKLKSAEERLQSTGDSCDQEETNDSRNPESEAGNTEIGDSTAAGNKAGTPIIIMEEEDMNGMTVDRTETIEMKLLEDTATA